MQDIYFPSEDGKTTAHACVWRTEEKPKAVLQIIHGMAEYAERYAPFAEYLTGHGIAVCADDHLGHGRSVTDKDKLGYFAEKDGWQTVLKDIRRLTEIMKGEYADVPYFVMGHSMGSFFCRKYISEYGDGLCGAIIMGTGYKSKFVTGAGKAATAIVAAFKGWEHRSKFIDNLAFGAYNKKTVKRTPYDWLSANEQNVDSYIADPLCGVMFTCNAFYGLFSICAQACKGKTFKRVPENLPLLLVAGSDDPVGDYSKGVVKVYDKLQKAGVKDVALTLYRGGRHEILNDNCAPQVYEDILAFIEEKYGKTL